MKLKARYASLDEIPESYRERYTQSDDGKSWALDEIEIEDVTGLKANSERLKKEKDNIKAELEKFRTQFADIDPEKAREAQKKLEELENKSLMDEGKFEELFMKRTDAMKRAHEAQLKAIQKLADDAAARAKTLESELARTVISTELVTQAGKIGILPEFVDLLQTRAEKDWTVDEQGKPVWLANGEIRYGKDGQPATMNEYLSEIVKERKAMLAPSGGGGANGSGSHRNGAIVLSTADARDVRKYEAAKAQAEKSGVPLQVTE